LPVWQQDIRWSLLGFALDRGGSDKEANGGGEAGGPEEYPDPRQSYLRWIEVELQVTFFCFEQLPLVYMYVRFRGKVRLAVGSLPSACCTRLC